MRRPGHDVERLQQIERKAERFVADIQVHLVAVERELWSGQAQLVVARTVDGDIGVMAGHSPLLAQLREGFAARIVEPNGNVLGVAVHGGFLSVTKEGVSILAEDAQLSDEIDVTKARAAYERAKSSGGDSADTEAELRRAQAQLLATGNEI
jgi:F-type H+-transporting ATPase subunit epsilon